MDLGMDMGIDTTEFGLFNPFQFTFEAPSPLPSSESESGGSTASFSLPNNPAAELANCVRKNAGVILAVQIGSEPQYPQYHPPAFTAPPAPSYPPPNTAASTFTTAPVAPTAPPTPATPVQIATQSHPKMSHTTIECRYPTKLNARIQSLRQAVPALCVVDRPTAIKAGEAYPDCAQVLNLGKAVEYIHVLKSHERRLSRELEGLKTLLWGLVGGTELLDEWEHKWVGVFGGGERNEVGVEGGGNAGEDNDGEDEEGGGGGEEEEEGEGGARKAEEGRPPPCVQLRAQGIALSRRSAQDWWEREGNPISLPLVSRPYSPYSRSPWIPRHRVTAAHPRRRVERSTGDAYTVCMPCVLRSSPSPSSSSSPLRSLPHATPPFPTLVHTAALPSRVQLALGSLHPTR
ncbi:hypothetical protein B0H16DRAFT_1811339 [Mycena metata]|uniref:BHLH domain-containing protein n=1 Tax=Mycena metata TaxID=1033252 RepID=A0AAD7H6E7_9AGAR|nr:hypothetical protein B0H16DRAFT_1811339 [Mycena metata]